jgi:RNA polymerase sigma factor for flagellar operon FliA
MAAYTRDPVGREQLILQHIPLVHHVIGRLAIGLPSVVDREDLVAHGVVGLIQAIDRFDPSQGVPFAAWASIRIRGAVLDAIRALDIMSPQSRQRVRALQAATGDLTARLGRSPSDDEIREALGCSPSDYAQILEAASCQIVSLDSGTDDEGNPLADLVNGKHVVDPSERAAIRAAIGQALRQLDERERIVLSLYYVEDLTLQEVANVIGVHKSVVVRNHSRAILKLRALLEVSGFVADSSTEDENDRSVSRDQGKIAPFPGSGDRRRALAADDSVDAVVPSAGVRRRDARANRARVS